MNTTINPSLATELRQLFFPWSFALLLPMPILMAGEGSNSDIATLYLAPRRSVAGDRRVPSRP